MTNQEFKRYTGPAYASIFKNLNAAIDLAYQPQNIGKYKVIGIGHTEEGDINLWAVMQNSLANKFKAEGFQEYAKGFKGIITL